MEYLDFKSKYKLLKSFSSVFSIKAGKVFKTKDGKCYRVNGWFAVLYKIYSFLLFSELAIVWVFLLYIFVEQIISLWWLNLIVCVFIYLLTEVVVVALIPLKKVPCWEKSLGELSAKKYGQ